MRHAIRFITRVYTLLLRLYPREFRDEFADEMHRVFVDTIADAAKRGNVAVIWVCLQELRDLPGAVLREHWQARRKSIMENEPRVPWLELLFAAIPFLFYLMFAILEGVQIGWTGAVVLLFVIMLPILLVVGLVKGLPRWSLPALGLILVILNYMMFGILGFLFLGITGTPPLFLREIFGSGFSYVGIGVLTFVIILVTALVEPLRPFFQRIRNDWTLFPFALYGIMPLVVLISFDEYHGSVPYEIGMGLVLLAGLWLYLRINQLGLKLLVLGVGVTLTMAIEAIGKWILIPSQRWVDLLQPYSVEQTIRGEVSSTIYTWFWVMVVVLLPAVLGLLPRPTRLTAVTQP